MLFEIQYTDWLGRKGSNLRITGSKPVALPLGYAPFGGFYLNVPGQQCKSEGGY